MRIFTLIVTTISGVLITSLIFLWFAAGEIYDYEDSFDLARDAQTIDVVVVLAGGKKRIPTAVELWKKIRDEKKAGPEPVLFLSGVGTNANSDILKEQGVPHQLVTLLNHDNFVFENVSENTFENAQLFSSFVRQKHWKHVVLVTAGYHMKRAEFILKKVMDKDVVLKTETVDAVHFDRNEWHKDAYAIRVTILEYFKWLYYRRSY